jgi:hypothetical protein
MHVLPAGFHRIRYYGMLTSSKRADNVARAREQLALASVIPIDAFQAASTKPDQPKADEQQADQQQASKHPCPCCGGRMIIIETFVPGFQPRHRPTPAAATIRIDTS